MALEENEWQHPDLVSPKGVAVACRAIYKFS